MVFIRQYTLKMTLHIVWHLYIYLDVDNEVSYIFDENTFAFLQIMIYDSHFFTVLVCYNFWVLLSDLTIRIN